jgi:hypothetical protein
MATATKESRASGQVTRSVAPPGELAAFGIVDRHGEYRCECGSVLRAVGGGRHRMYFMTR